MRLWKVLLSEGRYTWRERYIDEWINNQFALLLENGVLTRNDIEFRVLWMLD
jgi:hypothetical protein